jgi:hypothetical protein
VLGGHNCLRGKNLEDPAVRGSETYDSINIFKVGEADVCLRGRGDVKILLSLRVICRIRGERRLKKKFLPFKWPGQK